jgi:hypothetical protein
VLWGPTPATREILPVIGFALLVALGVYLLRELTVREFPDAQPGDTAARMRHWYANVRAHRGAGAGAAVATADAGNGSRVEMLERLASLHERGALSDEEFAKEKQQLTATSGG